MSLGSSHLVSTKLNVAQVLTAAQTELLELFVGPDIKKVLVWDPDLISPMSLIADGPFMRNAGVLKMVRLPVSGLTELYPEGQQYIFLVRPSLSIVDQVVEAIRTSKKKTDKTFTIAFTPNKAQHCISKLKEYGFEHGSKTPLHFMITEYHLDILPLDSDVISLDISTAFKDLFVDRDPTPVYQAARALGRLQALFGVIPKIYGKGTHAKVVAELLKNVQQQLEGSQVKPGIQQTAPCVDCLILLDRNVDLVTPLSTQLTYEGLIDEIYNINHCVVRFPCQMFSEEVLKKYESQSTGTLPIRLNSDESMFSDMRDCNFSAVGNFLSTKAKSIAALYESRHDAKTVAQLRKFVDKLPHMQEQKLSLSKHTTIAEMIKTVTDREGFLSYLHTEQDIREVDYSDKPHPYVEKLLGNPSEHPIEKVLKLICLQSCACNGLRPRLLEIYKREVLHAYGYQHLSTLLQLEKAGLIRSQEEKGGMLLRAQENRGFPALRKQLQLTAKDTHLDESSPNPQSLAYHYSGYAPLSIKLVEVLMKQGFAAFDELTRQLPGPPAFMQTQHKKQGQAKVEKSHLTLVFFLGGVTHAEISALRYLSAREDSLMEYAVGTTHILNGVSLISSVMEDTPLYQPAKSLWDNQLESPSSSASRTGRAPSQDRR